MRRKLTDTKREIHVTMWSTAFVLTTFIFLILPGVYGTEMLSLELPCQNGGVGFGGQCMCPLYVSGEHCENSDACSVKVDDQYTLADPFSNLARNVCIGSCDIDPSLICCWRERLAQTPTEAADDLSRVKSMLEFYGPWSANDKLMLDYFFGKQGSAFKYLTPTAAADPSAETSLAFVIMVHSDYQVRLPKMMDAIYKTKHTYVIHVDNSVTNANWHWIVNYVNDFNERNGVKNVHLLENRFRGGWGAISLVYLELAAIIELMRLTEATGATWSHVINLSAYDFPIKPLAHLEAFLSANKDTNYIEVLGNESRRPQRQSELYLSCGKSALTVNFSLGGVCEGTANWMYKHKSNWVYGEGSQWHILTREFLRYLVSSLDAIELLFSFKYTLIPDESFFQSALLSSPFSSKIYGYNYRFLPWADQLYVQPKHVPFLRDTNAFFVRKLLDPAMADVINKEVLAWHKQ